MAAGASGSRGAAERQLAPPRRPLEFLGERRRVRSDLAKLGIRRSRSSDAPVWILAALLALAGGGAAVGAATHSLSTEEAVALAAVVVTVAGLLVAVLQWRHGLAEKALDALYQRIELANRMRLEAYQDLDTNDERAVVAEHPELYRFYVFTEIDSLEYAARRYRFGLGLSVDIVDRAVRHFRGRCQESEVFREMAATCVTDGAYFPDTKAAVASILAEPVTALQRPAEKNAKMLLDGGDGDRLEHA